MSSLTTLGQSIASIKVLMVCENKYDLIQSLHGMLLSSHKDFTGHYANTEVVICFFVEPFKNLSR